jgi:hypothetical protein
MSLQNCAMQLRLVACIEQTVERFTGAGVSVVFCEIRSIQTALGLPGSCGEIKGNGGESGPGRGSYFGFASDVAHPKHHFQPTERAPLLTCFHPLSVCLEQCFRACFCLTSSFFPSLARPSVNLTSVASGLK